MIHRTHHTIFFTSAPSLSLQIEAKMECALKSSFRKEMGVKVLSEQCLIDDFWEINPQNVVGCDDFLVNEFLEFSDKDSGEYEPETEKTGSVSVLQQERGGDEKQRKVEKREEEDGGFAGKDEFVDISAGDIAVPPEDLWLSHFVEDSFAEPYLAGVSPEKPMKMVEVQKVAGRVFAGESPPVPAKARSKRSRTGGKGWSVGAPAPTEFSSSSGATSSTCSSPSSAWLIQYQPYPNPVHSGQNRFCKKHKKTGSAVQPPRRCSHCGVQKTPQWRTGPMGAKTLCNACGVRFKSGRLLPEYRPACSPTFSSELHSNHHRKVVEMRRKKEAPPGSDSGLGSQAVTSF